MAVKTSNTVTLVSVNDGEPGHVGRSLLSESKEYYLSTTSKEPTGGSWSESKPEYVDGRSYFTRFKQVWDVTGGTKETLYTNPVLDMASTMDASNALTAKSVADNAKEIADNANKSADGKNSIFYQSDPPTGGTYKTNDLWFDTDDSNTMYSWDGSKWDKKAFGNNAIASLDAGKITTGYLSADRIEGNSIGANKIVSGSITGDQIKAGSIGAKEINVSNLFAGDIVASGSITGLDLAAYNSPIANVYDRVFLGNHSTGGTGLENLTTSEEFEVFPDTKTFTHKKTSLSSGELVISSAKYSYTADTNVSSFEDLEDAILTPTANPGATSYANQSYLKIWHQFGEDTTIDDEKYSTGTDSIVSQIDANMNATLLSLDWQSEDGVAAGYLNLGDEQGLSELNVSINAPLGVFSVQCGGGNFGAYPVLQFGTGSRGENGLVRAEDILELKSGHEIFLDLESDSEYAGAYEERRIRANYATRIEHTNIQFECVHTDSDGNYSGRSIMFGVGSGGNNRGIYQGSTTSADTNNGYDNWLLFWDYRNHATCNTWLEVRGNDYYNPVKGLYMFRRSGIVSVNFNFVTYGNIKNLTFTGWWRPGVDTNFSLIAQINSSNDAWGIAYCVFDTNGKITAKPYRTYPSSPSAPWDSMMLVGTLTFPVSYAGV